MWKPHTALTSPRHPLLFLSFLCHPYILTIFLENFYSFLVYDQSHPRSWRLGTEEAPLLREPSETKRLERKLRGRAEPTKQRSWLLICLPKYAFRLAKSQQQRRNHLHKRYTTASKERCLCPSIVEYFLL